MVVYMDTLAPQIDEAEVRSFYEQLGLVSAADRARYVAPQPPAPALIMDVVISTSSQPFSG